MIYSRPALATWMVTLIATALSVATTICLSIAFKEALRHRMHEQISLIHLSSGIAMARGSLLFNVRHLIPTLVTLVVYGVTRLLVSSWTTLLMPIIVTQNVDASGWELDLTSSWLESTLQQELVQSGAALVRGNSSEIVDIGGVLSGIAAAQYSFGTSGIFNFNGAQYNISSGGVLPAAPVYGNESTWATNDVGLAFAGGPIPTHLNVTSPKDRAFHGLYNNYTLLQQGLTANVTCREIDTTAVSTSQQVPVPYSNGTTAYWLWAWNVTTSCSQGLPSQQQYVTRSNSSDTPQTGSNGFMWSLVCPYPLQQTNLSWEHLVVVTNSSWKYDFFPSTTCTIDPYLTTSLVTYSNDIINTTVLGSLPLGSGNSNLTLFLAAIIDYQSRTAQSLTANSIGDALYSVYISAAARNTSASSQDLKNVVLEEMEQYWRGVTEFSGTYLRSAFSVNPNIPPEARTPLTGHQSIITIGWNHQSETYGYTIIPITIVALMFYSAVAYILWNVYSEHRDHKSFTTFDPSHPIHLMMASSKRDLSAPRVPLDTKASPGTDDDLGDALYGFDRREIYKNETLQVKLVKVQGPGSYMRFKVETRPAP